MRIFWLKVISTIAKTGNRSITAKVLGKKPSFIPSTIQRAERGLGITLFHRIPWVNKSSDRLWDVADDRAGIVINYIDAILHEIGMLETIFSKKSLRKPDSGMRYLLCTEDIERIVRLKGRSWTTTGHKLGISTKKIQRSLQKVERWLGIKMYNNFQDSHHKRKVLTQIGELAYPFLLQAHLYYQDILELCDGAG